MSAAQLTSVAGTDCWNRIGISGDRSCPELEPYIHCRNCPVFARAAKAFLDRPAPEGYLAEWSQELASIVRPATSRDQSVLIFRLNDEWLALPTSVVVEVTATRPVHRIPHRSNEVLVGMVNLRGQLQLQIALQGLLGIDAGQGTRRRAGGGPAPTPRLVVMKREGQTWVFEASEVLGVRRFSREQLRSVPSTLANPDSSFSQAVIDWQEHSIGLIDEQRLFTALEGRSE